MIMARQTRECPVRSSTLEPVFALTSALKAHDAIAGEHEGEIVRRHPEIGAGVLAGVASFEGVAGRSSPTTNASTGAATLEEIPVEARLRRSKPHAGVRPGSPSLRQNNQRKIRTLMYCASLVIR